MINGGERNVGLAPFSFGSFAEAHLPGFNAGQQRKATIQQSPGGFFFQSIKSILPVSIEVHCFIDELAKTQTLTYEIAKARTVSRC